VLEMAAGSKTASRLDFVVPALRKREEEKEPLA
jgi:hypothetical protein